jgi:hypothetical protein
LKGSFLSTQQIENYDDQELPEINGVATSIAQAYPSEVSDNEEEYEADEEVSEDKPEVPQNDDVPEEPATAVVVPGKKKSPPKPVVEENEEDEEEDDEEEEQRVYKRNRQQGGAPIYFPVSFGKTNGGAIGKKFNKFFPFQRPSDDFIKIYSRS